MGLPIVLVDSGGIAVTESTNGIGMPVEVSMNGYGIAATLVASGGLPVIGANTEPTEPFALFEDNPPLDADDTNTGATFFVVAKLNSEEPLDQLRVTIAPASINTLTVLGVGFAKFVAEGTALGPITEATFSDASGFASQTTEQTSDWIDISELGLEAGDYIVISFTTGGSGQASTRYNDFGYVTDTYFKSGTSWDDAAATLSGYTKLAGYNYALTKIETRGLSGGGGVAPAENDIPMSWDDPMFSAITEYTNNVSLSSGQDLSRLSIVNQSETQAITCLGDNEVSYCRVMSRECVRLTSTATLTKCYFEAEGIEELLDHADTVQAFSAGQRGGNIVVTNSYIRAHLTAATAGFFVSDDWGGDISLDEVIIHGGPWGFLLHAEANCHLNVSLSNVYFVGPFGGEGGPYNILDIGSGSHTIVLWEDVYEATVVDGEIVLGDAIPAPASTVMPTNLFTSPDNFNAWTKTSATIETNVAADPVYGLQRADRFKEVNGSSQHMVVANSVSFVLGTTYTMSVYVKAETMEFIQLLFGSGPFGLNAWANFDIANGTLGTVASSATAAIEAVAGAAWAGWYRISITATATASASNGPVILGANSGTMTRASGYTGVDTETCLMANAQVIAGATPGPYALVA